jgi:hypothetical protein
MNPRTSLRTVVAVVIALSITRTIVAQGLVNFYNDANNPVFAQPLVYPQQPSTIMSGPRGSFYFGLLVYDRTIGINSLTFTGIYGTNTGANGFFDGGTVAVPGWMPGTSTNFIIAGWSANMGHDFSYSFFSGFTGGDFGTVQGVGVAGNGSTVPALSPWGSGSLTDFLDLRNNLVPEPSVAGLIAVGAGVSLFYRRRQKAWTWAAHLRTASEPAAKQWTILGLTLLIDTTGWTGHKSPDTLERYYVAQAFAEAAYGEVKVAMVVRPEMMDPEKFEVMVAKIDGWLEMSSILKRMPWLGSLTLRLDEE